MSRMTFVLSLFSAILLICPSALANTLPGQQINASVSATASAYEVVTASASAYCCDSSGNPEPQQQSSSLAIPVLTALPSVQSNTATVFVAPPSNADTYFITVRELSFPPSLVGTLVKVAGKIMSISGAPYIDDGSTLKVKTNNATKPYIFVPVYLMLRTDLLSSVPAAGTFVTAKGVIRMESNGTLSLLPYSNSDVNAL